MSTVVYDPRLIICLLLIPNVERIKNTFVENKLNTNKAEQKRY